MDTKRFLRLGALALGLVSVGSGGAVRRAAPAEGGETMAARVRQAAFVVWAERFDAPPELVAAIHAAAARAGLDPRLALAVVEAESGFDPTAVGREGEVGLMQLKLSVARAYGDATRAELMRPEVNLRYGLAHLKREVEHFGDPALGVLAYNIGRGRLERYLATGRVPASGYARRVLARCGC